MHRAEWRERPEQFSFSNHDYDGLYLKCCWFQLLDILKHRALLPKGWMILTTPRKFCQPRIFLYRNSDANFLQVERPLVEAEIDFMALYNSLKSGKDPADELMKLGIVWQV